MVLNRPQQPSPEQYLRSKGLGVDSDFELRTLPGEACHVFLWRQTKPRQSRAPSSMLQLRAPCSVFHTIHSLLLTTYRPTDGLPARGENAVIRAEYCPELKEAPPWYCIKVLCLDSGRVLGRDAYGCFFAFCIGFRTPPPGFNALRGSIALQHICTDSPGAHLPVTLAWEGKQSGHPAEQPARGGGEEACQAEDSFTVADSNRIQLNQTEAAHYCRGVFFSPRL